MKLLAIHRYPVKSMLGEELPAADVTVRGIPGDRAFALFDPVERKVVSAKAPHKWPQMFRFRAAMEDGAARIVFPDGASGLSADPDVHARLAQALGREVRLVSDSGAERTIEMVVFDPERPEQKSVSTFALPASGFFDSRPLHLLTTATLRHLRALYPEGAFEVARFRPNLMLDVEGVGFLEDSWIGRTVAIGDVRLRIDKPCARCVMITLPQGELPPDTGILRTAARHNRGNIGVLASVLTPGRVQRGDRVELV